MTTHVLAYIKRHVATQSPESSERDPAVMEALTAPAGHGFGQDWLWDRRRRGDDIVIWLVSVLRSGRRYMPPSLDARIDVGEAFDRWHGQAPPYVRRLLDTYKYAFTAEPSRSYYLPWLDASQLLQGLRFVGETAPSWLDNIRAENWSLLPRNLQTPRVLTAADAALVEEFAARARSASVAFLSYRWGEGTEAAREVALGLSEVGVAVWWDRWSMPRSVAELKGEIPSEGVCRAIEAGCSSCRYGIAIKSESYASPKSPWTTIEYEELRRRAQEGGLKLIEVTVSHNGSVDNLKAKLEGLR
jgi:hypothetical protein